jgi:hypothetical protein
MSDFMTDNLTEQGIESLDGQLVHVFGDFYTAKVDAKRKSISLSKPFDPTHDQIWDGNSFSSPLIKDVKTRESYRILNARVASNEVGEDSQLVRCILYSEAYSVKDLSFEN